MNILVLGCSWTSGLHDHPYNWVTALAEMMPEHTFYNCAHPGTSLLHSIWIMEKCLEQSNEINGGIKFDKIIFQITNEGRLTYYHELDDFKVNDWIRYKTDNLYALEIDWQKLCIINYGVLIPENSSPNHGKWKEIRKFAKDYYTRCTRQHHFNLEHKILAEYVKNKADLVFFHRRDDNNISGILSIQDILGDEQFKKFVIDSGDHFGIAGCQWQAKHIKTLLESGLDESNIRPA